jgi:hypothetical protein
MKIKAFGIVVRDTHEDGYTYELMQESHFYFIKTDRVYKTPALAKRAGNRVAKKLGIKILRWY